MKPLLLGIAFMSTAVLAKLPEGFVYVNQIDPTIKVDLRYLTDQNFIGEPLNGYKNPVAILTREAAQALSKVQQELLANGYSLVIYDAYRPQKTVDQFVEWSKNWQDNKMKEIYYPRVNKQDLFKLHYIAEKSSHTRGSTVDISIIPIAQPLKKVEDITEEKRTLTDKYEIIYLNDNTVDMGAAFDLFDDASHPNSHLVDETHRDNREYLRKKMEKHGFEGFPTEWWHFTLKNEPYADVYFNFDIE